MRKKSSLIGDNSPRKHENVMKYLLLNILILSFALLLGGCAEEILHEGTPGKETKARITFNLTLPNEGSHGLATRAAKDNQIENIYVLGFRVDEQDETKEYFNSLSLIDTDIEDMGNNKREIKVTVNREDYKQRFVLIANAPDLISPLTPQGQQKEDVLNALIYSNSNEEWQSFPMWGESDAQVFNTTESSIEVTLIRMVAAIDVSLSETAHTSFTLKEVYLYNPKTRGYLVPGSANWNPEQNKVVAPTVPEDNLANDPLTKATPSLYEIKDAAATSLEGAIYAFEAQAVTDDLLKSTCLVIGGEYKGKRCYYRIDFIGKDENGDPFYRDILRNHKYVIHVANVLGEGKPSPEDALNNTSPDTDMEAEVIAWNNASINVDFDKQYYLKVSTDYISAQGNATNEVVTVETNHPDGITISNNSWFEVYKGNQNGQVSYLVVAIPENTEGQTRNGFFQVIAGNLRYTIEVNQTHGTWLSIQKEDYYLMDGGSYIIDIDTQYGWTVSLKDEPQDGEEALLTILTEGNNSFQFQTFDDLSRMRLDPDATPKDPTEVTLIVEQLGGSNLMEITVTLVSGNVAKPSNCYILKPLSPSDQTPYPGLFIPVERANDPLVQSMTHTPINEDSDFSAELIWTDHPNGIAQNSCIRAIRKVGNGSTGYIYVEPGSEEGNAAVGVFMRDANFLQQGRWNWHIWVSHDKDNIELGSAGNPNWMDRNLGALTTTWAKTPDATTRGDKVMGLFYQWGRHTPFPDDPEVLTDYNIRDDVSSPYAQLAIWNPDKYVAHDQWLGSNGSNMANSWHYTQGASAKTVFDPCPEGWRVPTATEWGEIRPSFGDGIGITGLYANYYPYAGANQTTKLHEHSAVGEAAFYWAANGDASQNASCLIIKDIAANPTLTWLPLPKRSLCSVRCIREKIF